MLGCPPSPPVTTRSLNMNPVANRKCSCKASKTHPGLLLATGLVFYTLEYVLFGSRSVYRFVLALARPKRTEVEPISE